MLLNTDVNKKYTVIGMAWLLFFSATSFFAYMQVLVNIPLSYPIAVFLGSASYLYFLKKENISVKVIVINSTAIVACVMLATFLHDFSWDGQAYHMEAVRQLVSGWNIYHGMPLAEYDTMHYIWLNSYPKATWMFGGALYAVTGSLLSCKSYMFILCVANALLLRNIVGLYVKNKWFARGIIFTLVANPVVSSQLLSTYLDGALYLICLAISLLLIGIAANGYEFPFLGLAVLTSAVGFNLKFTAVAYVGLIWLCFMTYLLLNKQKMLYKALRATLASVFIGLLVIGYNPYVTNLINEGHPFWPVRGTHDLQNVMLACANEEFLEQNRFLKLGSSWFSKSSNEIATMENVEYKIPFTVSKSEIKAITGYDCRIGGWGIWFSGILLLSVISIMITLRHRIRYNSGILCIFGFIIISIIINPESWVARYAPQMYVVPILVLIMLNYVENINIKRFANIFLLVVVLNTIVILAGRAALQGFYEYSDYRMLSEAKNHQPVMVWSSGMFETVLETRFKYHNVNYSMTDYIDRGSDIQIRGVGNKDEHIRIWLSK